VAGILHGTLADRTQLSGDATYRDLGSHFNWHTKHTAVSKYKAMNRCVAWVAALALPVVGTFLCWAVLFGISLHERSQAQSVIAAVNSMQVGTSTFEEVRSKLARYHTYVTEPWVAKQYSADSGIYLGFGNRIMARMGDRFSFLRYVGLAPWAANTEIYFRNKRVCELRVELLLETKKINGNRAGYFLSTRQSSDVAERFVISGGHVTGGSRYVFYRVETITLPVDATPTERAHAFGYDLSCVARLGGCRDLNQILDLKSIGQDRDNRRLD
jgi:hypothetical protein